MENGKLTLNDLPTVPKGSSFHLAKIDTVVLPHPYCITPKHLEYCDSMYLDAVSIERAEGKGAVCDICKQLVRKGKQSKVLSYREHESMLTLFVSVPQNTDLNAIPGLHAYLLKVKEANLGIQGFAFPLTGRKHD